MFVGIKLFVYMYPNTYKYGMSIINIIYMIKCIPIV